jgi:hypothetical protein
VGLQVLELEEPLVLPWPLWSELPWFNSEAGPLNPETLDIWTGPPGLEEQVQRLPKPRPFSLEVFLGPEGIVQPRILERLAGMEWRTPEAQEGEEEGEPTEAMPEVEARQDVRVNSQSWFFP